MNKSKSRDELIAIEADREIAGWDPQNADFMGLVLKDIERVPLDAESDDDCRVVNELIAYLEGDLDIESKKRILCACDRAADSTKVVPLDKLIGIFHSRLVPYEWKFKVLKRSLKTAYYQAFGLSWMPAEYEAVSESVPEPFRMILGCSFHRPDEAEFEAMAKRLRELEKDSPGSVSKLVDCYGNNMLHYVFIRYWSTDCIGSWHERGEYCGTCGWFLSKLWELGCDPKQENVFGIAQCELRFEPWMSVLGVRLTRR